MVMFQRFVQAWAAWHGLPGLVHRVHELVLELVAEAPALRQAGKSIGHELAQYAAELRTLRLQLRMNQASPVTVVLMATPDRVDAHCVIGSRTVYLLPGHSIRVEFPIRQVFLAGAFVWVHGPGLLQEVSVGHDRCTLSESLGPMVVIPDCLLIGQQVLCVVKAWDRTDHATLEPERSG